MTGYAETLIDMAFDMGHMMASRGHELHDDSRELVQRIHRAAEEFELTEWDFDGNDDYFDEQTKATESLYQELVDEGLIGPPEPESDTPSAIAPELFANFYYTGNVSTHKTAEAAREAANDSAEEIAVPMVRAHGAGFSSRDAVGYLAKELQTDWAHTIGPKTRVYNHAYKGNRFRITVERLDKTHPKDNKS